MRESRPYGFVRGALSNERPYRVPDCPLCGGLRLKVEIATKLGDFLRKEIGAGKVGLSQ